MESQIYLALVGEEHCIKEFAARVNVAGASVRELGARALAVGAPRPWKWRTARKAAYTPYPEDSVAPILREHEHLLADISRQRLQTSVTIVCKVAVGERPPGFSFSAETIQLLNQFNASLEVDFVSSMSPPESVAS